MSAHDLPSVLERQLLLQLGDRLKQLRKAQVRISAIVDAYFRLIVDGKTVLPRRRWGSAQELV